MSPVGATGLLHADADSLGALLVGIGALLLLIDAVTGPTGIEGFIWARTLPTPERRLSSGLQVAGATFAVVGSALLLANARHLGTLVIVICCVIAAAIAYLVMALRLRAQMTERHEPKPLTWCLGHPWWRPPSNE